MVGTGRVEDVLDLVVLSLRPLGVHRATVLDDAGPDGDEAEGDDRLLVHHVVLIADGVGAETSGAAEDGRLADEAVAGQGVDDALGLLLGVLSGHVAGVADGGDGEGREGSAGEGRSEEGSACLGGQLSAWTRDDGSPGVINWTPSTTSRARIERTDSAARQAGSHCE